MIRQRWTDGTPTPEGRHAVDDKRIEIKAGRKASQYGVALMKKKIKT